VSDYAVSRKAVDAAVVAAVAGVFGRLAVVAGAILMYSLSGCQQSDDITADSTQVAPSPSADQRPVEASSQDRPIRADWKRLYALSEHLQAFSRDPSQWPQKVTLKNRVDFYPTPGHGQPFIGRSVPPGTEVEVISVTEKRIVVEFAGYRREIFFSDTDILDRVTVSFLKWYDAQ